MDWDEFYRVLESRGWGFQVRTARMFDDDQQPVIGLQLLLDRKDGVLRSAMVRHDDLAGVGAVLAAAVGLMGEG